MTTHVRKGAGRPAATARSNRHAQHTPLPPKPGVVEQTREVLAAAASALESHGEALDARSVGKARTFAEKAGELGWTVLKEVRGGACEVTATRGAETIVQAWAGGVWEYDASVYAFGDRTTKPRNASGALKLLARSEPDAAAEANKVQTNRHFRRAEPQGIQEKLEKAQKHLPFDPELATDEEVCGVLAGQAVVWYNRIGRSNESAIVGRKGAWITMLPDGQRVVNFCCPVTGFRACLVTALLKVGRGRSVKAETASVEVS